MNLKTAFWSLFTICFALALLYFFTHTYLEDAAYSSIKVRVMSTSIPQQFVGLHTIIGTLLLLPLLFLLVNVWVNFRSFIQVWMFLLSALLFGALGYLFRLYSVIQSTMKNTIPAVDIEPSITLDSLKFEQYFFYGTVVGCALAGWIIGWRNKRIS